MAAYVDRLARDPHRRRTMGADARASVRDRSWQAVNDLLLAHYREVIGGEFALLAA